VTTSIDQRIAETFQWTQQNRDAARLRLSLQERGCFIYGAGGYGRDVAAEMSKRGYTVHGFIDRNATVGQKIATIPCLAPAAVDLETAARSVLVIGVNNFKTPVDDVVAWAGEGRFFDIIFVPELPDVIDVKLGNYWQADRELIHENREALARLSGMLADERSRVILDQLVRYRMTGRPEDHPAVDRERQYFPADLPMPRRAIAVVDCGAFPGDMIEAVNDAGLILESWYAFEPDPKNFLHLSAVARGAAVQSAALFPCGVGDATGMFGFAGGSADASRALADVSAGQGDMLPIVRVDDVVHARRIDLVKLDIEGFEAQALDGMADLLRTHRPRLAMAVYHKPTDLWKLAFKVDDMFPGGRFALRQHGFNGYDTVLYVDWDQG
jgi:FkbM family methyltransferase